MSDTDEVDEPVVVTGVVADRKILHRKDGIEFVKAKLRTDDGAQVSVVWWNASNAPSDGRRVSVEGSWSTYKGRADLKASRTRTERTIPSDHPGRLVGYFRECIEAESAQELSVTIGSRHHIELTAGAAPLSAQTPTLLPDTIHTAKWLRQRVGAIGEVVLVGYPVVVSQDASEQTRLRAIPLFLGELTLNVNDAAGPSVVLSTDALDLNPNALVALGLGDEERDACLTSLEESVEYEEAGSAEERVRIGISILQEVTGIDALDADQLDPLRLEPLESEGSLVQNSALVLVSTGGAVATRKLVEELEELAGKGKDLVKGPLGVLLGSVVNDAPSFVEPYPIVVPSTLRQDQAVHSAMKNTLTVVTGPPGTGKSQVLVNVVAAAVASGQSVLFASKNNKAVDVVLERMRAVSPRANLMRCGASSKRSALAAEIGAALDRSDVHPSVAAARSGQAEVDELLREVYERLRKRVELIAEIDDMRRSVERDLSAFPAGCDVNADLEVLRAQVAAAATVFGAFGKPLPFFRRRKRWQIHSSRLDAARDAGQALDRFLREHRLGSFDVDAALSSVSAKPCRTLRPKASISDFESKIVALDGIQERNRTAHELQILLDTDYQTWRVDDLLADLVERRISAGRELLEGVWDQRLTSNATAVREARLLQADLDAAGRGESGARSARTRIAHVLPALPAWGVTSLSAGTNFPLQSAMFDLVVIDEASQCDIASALPLLYRGKRGMIIGDQRQLIHITQIGEARSAAIAGRWQLTDEDLGAFDYRSRSLFTLAASRVERPVMLDMHFRSQAAIIGFSNSRFYGSELQICTPRRSLGDDGREPTLVWKDVEGDAERGPSGRSWRNMAEAQAVVETLGMLLTETEGTGQTIGVVTPYRAQVEEVREMAVRQFGVDTMSRVAIDSVHRFQGDERDVMILSPVVGPSMSDRQVSFASNPNLVNVALTRARHRLIVVGNQNACLRVADTVLAEFARYVARLEASGFDSPLELALHEELLARGVSVEPGRTVAGRRLDLAYERGSLRLDIECDGAAFHTNTRSDEDRDALLRSEGWEVLRFSGRELSRDVGSCADRVVAIVEASDAPKAPTGNAYEHK